MGQHRSLALLGQLLLGAGRRHLPIPAELGDDRQVVEERLRSHFGRQWPKPTGTTGLMWQDDPPEIRITHVSRFGSANDRARVITRVDVTGRPCPWLEQRVNPATGPVMALLVGSTVILTVAAALSGDARSTMTCCLLWLGSRSVVEITRRADSRRLGRFLTTVAPRAGGSQADPGRGSAPNASTGPSSAS